MIAVHHVGRRRAHFGVLRLAVNERRMQIGMCNEKVVFIPRLPQKGRLDTAEGIRRRGRGGRGWGARERPEDPHRGYVTRAFSRRVTDGPRQIDGSDHLKRRVRLRMVLAVTAAPRYVGCPCCAVVCGRRIQVFVCPHALEPILLLVYFGDA